MNQKQFTPEEKEQYWSEKLADIERAEALLRYFKKQIAQRLKTVQATTKAAAKV